MAMTIGQQPAPQLNEEQMAAWLDVPTTIISDELNRFGAMDAGIRPLADGVSFVGEALTVRVIAGDNAALHHAVAHARPGVVIVADAGGHMRSAVWGGILQLAAQAKGVRGVVIDGAIRDKAELRVATAPVFARGATPAGPHKGWGGDINQPIQCGGCPVSPGDLVRGDDDGVVIVPSHLIERLLQACRKRMAMEAGIEKQISLGASTVDLLKLPNPDSY
jgi:4-hydroxy-4-methyl-2-oxoglutarate aldolase